MCAMGGWGPMFGTKSQINTVFFDTFHVMQYDYFFRTYNVHAMSFTPEEIFEEVGWIGKD